MKRARGSGQIVPSRSGPPTRLRTMPELTRQALYDLVWAEPVRTVAASFGISDVGLKKHCLSADVPVPDRGYWAKLKAGKPVIRVRLPPRSPGKADLIHIGGRAGSGRHDPEAELREPPPEPPVFEEDLASVRQRVARTVGKVVRSRDLAAPVPAIRRLLAADAQRSEKFQQDPWPWHAPYFQSPFEQRRLRLLDALAKALSRQGGKVEISGGVARSLRFKVGDQYIDFTLDHPKAKPDQWGRDAVQTGPAGPLRLQLKPRWRKDVPKVEWSDAEGSKLEDQLTDIVVSVIVAGEAEYRNFRRSMHRWALERRARCEREVIERREEADRHERERIEREAKARRDLLLSQAAALRTAMDIRGFVAAVVEQAGEDKAAEFEPWRRWGLGEADRIDPVQKGELQPPDS